MADHVVIFNRGRIEQQGRPEEIAQAPVSPFVMNFVGDTIHLPSNCQVGKVARWAPACGMAVGWHAVGDITTHPCSCRVGGSVRALGGGGPAPGSCATAAHPGPSRGHGARTTLSSTRTCLIVPPLPRSLAWSWSSAAWAHAATTPPPLPPTHPLALCPPPPVLPPQLVRRMGLRTSKAWVMCRPQDLLLHRVFSEGMCPVTVVDKAHMGWAVRYYLKFDDGVQVEISVTR